MAIESIFIKPSKRNHSVSDYKCFDIYDQDMKKIDMPDCDVIDICIDNVKRGYVSMEVLNGMIHIWSHRPLRFEKLISTLNIHVEQENEKKCDRNDMQTLRYFIHEHQRGTWNTFVFTIDGHKYQCHNVNEFIILYGKLSEHLLDDYYVRDVKITGPLNEQIRFLQLSRFWR